MKNTTIHSPVAPFEVQATGLKDVHLTKLDGWYVALVRVDHANIGHVLAEFSSLYHRFKVQDCVVFGVSDSDLTNLEAFKSMLELPFYLISDAALLDLIAGSEGDGYAALIDDTGILRARYSGEPSIESAREILDEVKMMHSALDFF